MCLPCVAGEAVAAPGGQAEKVTMAFAQSVAGQTHAATRIQTRVRGAQTLLPPLPPCTHPQNPPARETKTLWALS